LAKHTAERTDYTPLLGQISVPTLILARRRGCEFDLLRRNVKLILKPHYCINQKSVLHFFN
jgi:hypothetical protein